MSNNSITETRILMNFMILYFVNLEILWEDQVFLLIPI